MLRLGTRVLPSLLTQTGALTASSFSSSVVTLAKKDDTPAATGSLVSSVGGLAEDASLAGVSDVMRATTAKASAKDVPVSQKKAEEILALVRGLPVEDALRQLKFIPRASARAVAKVVRAAMMAGENNFGMRRERMVVDAAWSGRSAPLKRIMFHSKGRMGLKARPRTHLFVNVVHVPYVDGEVRLSKKARKHSDVDREIAKAVDPLYSPPPSTPVGAGSANDGGNDADNGSNNTSRSE